MSIEWTDKLSVGNDIIDEDHKHLIKLINAYELAVSTGNIKLLDPAFESLEQYADAHFEREEKLMAAVYFPMRRVHADAHKKLLKLVHEKHQDVIEQGENIDVPALSEFLRHWLIDHVLKEDMQIKPYVTGGRDDNLTPTDK